MFMEPKIFKPQLSETTRTMFPIPVYRYTLWFLGAGGFSACWVAGSASCDPYRCCCCITSPTSSCSSWGSIGPLGYEIITRPVFASLIRLYLTIAKSADSHHDYYLYIFSSGMGLGYWVSSCGFKRRCHFAVAIISVYQESSYEITVSIKSRLDLHPNSAPLPPSNFHHFHLLNLTSMPLLSSRFGRSAWEFWRCCWSGFPELGLKS